MGTFLKDQGRIVFTPGKETVNSWARGSKGHPDSGGWQGPIYSWQEPGTQS